MLNYAGCWLLMLTLKYLYKLENMWGKAVAFRGNFEGGVGGPFDSTCFPFAVRAGVEAHLNSAELSPTSEIVNSLGICSQHGIALHYITLHKSNYPTGTEPTGWLAKLKFEISGTQSRQNQNSADGWELEERRQGRRRFCGKKLQQVGYGRRRTSQ